MEARLGLAYTYTKLKRDIDALNEMNNLVEMFPDSSIVYEARAEVEKGMQSYETALYDIDEALKRAPGKRSLYVSKAETLLALGRKKDAKRTLDEAVRNGTSKGLLLEWYEKCE